MTKRAKLSLCPAHKSSKKDCWGCDARICDTTWWASLRLSVRDERCVSTTIAWYVSPVWPVRGLIGVTWSTPEAVKVAS